MLRNVQNPLSSVSFKLFLFLFDMYKEKEEKKKRVPVKRGTFIELLIDRSFTNTEPSSIIRHVSKRKFGFFFSRPCPKVRETRNGHKFETQTPTLVPSLARRRIFSAGGVQIQARGTTWKRIARVQGWTIVPSEMPNLWYFYHKSKNSKKKRKKRKNRPKKKKKKQKKKVNEEWQKMDVFCGETFDVLNCDEERTRKRTRT